MEPIWIALIQAVAPVAVATAVLVNTIITTRWLKRLSERITDLTIAVRMIEAKIRGEVFLMPAEQMNLPKDAVH